MNGDSCSVAPDLTCATAENTTPAVCRITHRILAEPPRVNMNVFAMLWFARTLARDFPHTCNHLLNSMQSARRAEMSMLHLAGP